MINKFLSFAIVAVSLCLYSCNDTEEVNPPPPEEMEEEMMEEMEEELVEGVDYFLPNIDLNNWKVTLPIGNPLEIKPPAILDYANNEILHEFMFNDSIKGTLDFYTYPGASTTNSSYSRTELMSNWYLVVTVPIGHLPKVGI